MQEAVIKNKIDGQSQSHDRLITVQIRCGAEDISDFAQSWDDLFDRACDAPPFLSRHWISTFVGEGKINGIPLFVLCWCQNKLVALFPLTVRRYLGTRIAEPIGDWLPSYLGLLIDPDYPDVIECIAERFRAGDIADIFCIQGLSSEDGTTNSLLVQLAGKNFSVYRAYRDTCPFIRLGCSYEEYLQNSKSGKSRQTLRRKEKQLHIKHVVNIENYSNDEITDNIIERIASIQEQSWMKRRGAAVLGHPFYRKLLLNTAQAGLARAWLMTVDGVDAAFVFALIAHRKLYYAWTAFKLEFATSLSVGQVLTSRVINDACADGILIFDFEHGDAAYKRFWGTDEHKVYRAVAGRGVRGRILSIRYYISWRLIRVKWLRSFYSRLKNLPGGIKRKITRT